MTKFEKRYGWTAKPNYRNVYDNVKRMLAQFDRLVSCEEVLKAVYDYFGADNMIHDAAIEGWLDFYTN